MKNFKGFDDWVAIFKGGRQTDSNGREHDGDDLINKAVETFDPVEHEPPVCVGHPADNAPAFGWVRELKKTGNVLYAKLQSVVPEFEGAVRQGLYKKRSASFYPDGRLRHVGFLGAAPPAVKGLAGIKFEDHRESVSFDFYDPGMSAVATILRNIRDWLIETHGKEKADGIIPDWDVNFIKELANEPNEDEVGAEIPRPAFSQPNTDARAQEAVDMKETMLKMLSSLGFKTDKIPEDALPDAPPGGDGNFSEADVKAAQDAAVEAEREKVAADFAEKDRAAKQEIRSAKIPIWCDQMVKEGKLTPALVKFGVPEILSFLAASDDVLEFGEEKSKATAFDQLVSLFETQLPKIVNFGEIATRATDTGGKDAKAQIEELIKTKMEADKTLVYGVAFTEVQAENPELLNEYVLEIQ